MVRGIMILTILLLLLPFHGAVESIDDNLNSNNYQEDASQRNNFHGLRKNDRQERGDYAEIIHQKLLQEDLTAQERRKLLFGFFGNNDEDEKEASANDSLLINKILARFMPRFNSAFQDQMGENYEPYALDIADATPLGEPLELFGGLCKATVFVSYTLGQLYGLSSLVLQNIQIDEDSKFVDFALIGDTRFGATLNVQLSIPDDQDVSAESSGGFHAKVCGYNMKRSIHGMAGIGGVSSTVKLSVAGFVNGLKGSITKVIVEDVDIVFSDLSLGFDLSAGEDEEENKRRGLIVRGFEDMVPKLSDFAVQSLTGDYESELSNLIGIVIKVVANGVIEDMMPYDFALLD